MNRKIDDKNDDSAAEGHLRIVDTEATAAQGDDAEGHKRRPLPAADDDVEGHRTRLP